VADGRQSQPPVSYFAFIVAIFLGAFLYLGYLISAPSVRESAGRGGEGPTPLRSVGRTEARSLTLVPETPSPEAEPDAPAPGGEMSPALADSPRRSAIGGEAAAPAERGREVPLEAAAAAPPPSNEAAAAERSAEGAAPTATKSPEPAPDGEEEAAVSVQREAEQGERIYIVRPGDTLTGIARRLLGSARRWREIARRNGIDDPQALRLGQRLSVPSLRREAEADETEDVRLYRVEDETVSLYSLAMMFYGDSEAVSLLRRANKEVLGGSSELKPGMVLRIPLTDLPGARGSRSYTIRPGDTLSEIAEKFYNDGTKWRAIQKANPRLIPNADDLRVGTTIQIPDL
jgi:nucleoid-associated protein YgaU